MSDTKPAKRPREPDPLSLLEVIDRLEVGPVKVESRRVSAPYRVIRGGAEHKTELTYRFEEEVFDPADEASLNLASLVTAQVALNYGLFCGEIVFRGPFDRADRSFLREMAANTAREIYVKKFLEPNPFLVGPAAEMPPVRRSSYLAARLEFPDLDTKDRRSRSPLEWAAERSRAAVLSSGGKDSLLSYGLLKELEYETHAVFVNESGRHWHTALNAYRHLRTTATATTVRVWTSADRVFTWMLQHLPFVRQDFARLRSDEYPVRLWTVAVFLFGALPVLRKRGIGRLVIGDEFDTTRRTRHRGIFHYDGLYDQSRFFDETLTSFYQRKEWPLRQFSILRQMSELLIQKTLTERYPELQRHQVSCHATHIEGERTLPCGRCEKCRRIVGMLLALNADPGECGYSEEQQEDCLSALAARGVHQELAGAQQLAWLLSEKGLLAERTPGLGRARRRQEILQLRFDANASPASGVPVELRRPLFDLLSQHSDGSIQRKGRLWVPFDPLAEEGEVPPTVLEPERSTRPAPYLLAELTWMEAKARFEETDLALLPVGSTEQHGPHLPLDIDAWDADHLCRAVASRCSDPKPLVLPLIPYGVSYHHDDFPGTLSVAPETLAQFVYEVGMAAARHGVKKLLIINGHGGNAPALQLAAQKINRDAHIFTCVDSGETSDTDIAKLTETRNDVHAGEVETSTALATRPELVNEARLEPAVPEFSSHYLDFSSAFRVEWYEHTAKISDSGVLGDPTKATREKGEKIWQLMIGHLVRFVETLKGLQLDEILENRH